MYWWNIYIKNLDLIYILSKKTNFIYFFMVLNFFWLCKSFKIVKGSKKCENMENDSETFSQLFRFDLRNRKFENTWPKMYDCLYKRKKNNKLWKLSHWVTRFIDSGVFFSARFRTWIIKRDAIYWRSLVLFYLFI